MFELGAREDQSAVSPVSVKQRPGLQGHKIFLFGGYDGKGRTNELYILDTAEAPSRMRFICRFELMCYV